jgi:hypothetical protein
MPKAASKVRNGKNKMTPRFKRVRLIVTVSLMLLCNNAPARAAITQTAQKCGAKPDEPPQRVFADPDGLDDWREYKELKAVPEGNPDGSGFARLWAGSNGQEFVLVQWSNQDWAWYAEYCFDKSGQLTQLRYELRTALGWGRREEGSFANGKFAAQTSEFFSTESGQSIKRPETASDFESALEPQIYQKKSQLPFSKLLHS